MRLPSSDARSLLDTRSREYEANREQVLAYLTTRGIPDVAAERYRLGIVEGHPDEWLNGRLSIPYLTPSGVLQLKYRCLRGHDCKAAGCPKFLYDGGNQLFLYNGHAALEASPLIFVTEGEPDTWAIETLTGYPSVAIPGASAWVKNRYWARVFTAHRRVILPADGDRAGKELADAMSADLPQLQVARMPNELDANDVLRTEGVEAFLSRCSIEESERVPS